MTPEEADVVARARALIKAHMALGVKPRTAGSLLEGLAAYSNALGALDAAIVTLDNAKKEPNKSGRRKAR